MFGSVEIQARSLRLGLLVDYRSSINILEAIRLSASLWGGNYSAIIARTLSNDLCHSCTTSGRSS
jgi:hypothetical protein